MQSYENQTEKTGFLVKIENSSDKADRMTEC